MRFPLTRSQWRQLEKELREIRRTHDRCIKESLKAQKRLKDFEDVFEEIVRRRV